MSKKSYYELLRDPQWQRKRLEILERDEWSCLHCGDVDKPLNVHHRYYQGKKKPWEYEDESLVTLCEECHKGAEHLRRALVRTGGLLHDALAMQAIGYMEALAAEDVGPVGIMPVRSYEHALGIAHVFKTTAEQIIELTGANQTIEVKALFKLSGYDFDAVIAKAKENGTY